MVDGDALGAIGIGRLLPREGQRAALVAGAMLLAAIALLSLGAPWIATHDPHHIDPFARLQPGSTAHWFGTDALGRDVFSRAVWGARVSMVVALSVALIASAAGLVLGLAAGFVPRLDGLVMRVMEGLMAIPGILLAIALMAVTRASLATVLVAICVPEVPRIVCLVRSLAFTLREQPFIEAARAAGTRTPALLARHVLPAMTAPVLAHASFVAASAVLLEAALSFLGLGVPASTPSWGNMMADGRHYVGVAFHTLLYPGLLLAATVLAIHLLGDGLGAVLDRRVWGAVTATASHAERSVEERPVEGATLLDVIALSADVHGQRLVDGVSFSLNAGRTLGLVGESGCGKSITALSIMRLLPSPLFRLHGSVRLRGTGLLAMRESAMRRIRGRRIAMIFQSPMSALNPLLTVGRQIAEAVRAHGLADRRGAARLAVQALRAVEMPDPERCADAYPHELSGGMRQRAVIALALACEPQVLIADEPTTALDATHQAQTLALLGQLQRELGMGMLLITHDLGVVAETCDRVVVMYAGRKVEEADTAALFERPLHPYTQALLMSARSMHSSRRRLVEIPGGMPARGALGAACAFAARCSQARPRCRVEQPRLIEHGAGRWVACFAIERRWQTPAQPVDEGLS